ncbi:MAG: DUF1893 domain-containing protein [Candidatus Aenigmatarchaeota archaeon]
MDDLNLAKKKLKENNLTLAIAKNGEIIFESNSEGIKDLIKAIDLFKKELNGAALADKIVGKAVALLCLYSKISSVFAETISMLALQTLEDSKIFVEYEKIVPKILNKRKDDICPFEKISLSLNSPSKAYEKFKSILSIHQSRL